MDRDELRRKIAHAWDGLTAHYQKNTEISTRDIHYGWLAHGERRLGLIGNVKGIRALEIGCGGGQNTIALARWGAEAYGVDPSRKQIEHARRLAQECEVDAAFHVTPAEDLSQFQDSFFDLVLSSYAFGYVSELAKAYAEAYRVLKAGGTFVMCTGHPYFSATISALIQDPDHPGVRNYLAWPEVDAFDWGPVKMLDVFRTISQLINCLLEAGFVLEKVLEQGVEDVKNMSEEEKAEIPYLCHYDEREYPIARKIPCTIILKARKPVGE
ncbi:MAG: class I SAM-dependent methyltransferase [Thermoplasmata archaeon]